MIINDKKVLTCRLDLFNQLQRGAECGSHSGPAQQYIVRGVGVATELAQGGQLPRGFSRSKTLLLAACNCESYRQSTGLLTCPNWMRVLHQRSHLQSHHQTLVLRWKYSEWTT